MTGARLYAMAPLPVFAALAPLWRCGARRHRQRVVNLLCAEGRKGREPGGGRRRFSAATFRRTQTTLLCARATWPQPTPFSACGGGVANGATASAAYSVSRYWRRAAKGARFHCACPLLLALRSFFYAAARRGDATRAWACEPCLLTVARPSLLLLIFMSFPASALSKGQLPGATLLYTKYCLHLRAATASTAYGALRWRLFAYLPSQPRAILLRNWRGAPPRTVRRTGGTGAVVGGTLRCRGMAGAGLVTTPSWKAK